MRWSIGEREPEKVVDPGSPGSFPKLRVPVDHGDQPEEVKRSSTPHSSEASYIRDSIEFTDYSDTDEYLEAFYRRLGYLPPLGDAVLDALVRLLPKGMDVEAATGRI